jgi:hypothetical protein
MLRVRQVHLRRRGGIQRAELHVADDADDGLSGRCGRRDEPDAEAQLLPIGLTPASSGAPPLR